MYNYLFHPLFVSLLIDRDVFGAGFHYMNVATRVSVCICTCLRVPCPNSCPESVLDTLLDLMYSCLRNLSTEVSMEVWSELATFRVFHDSVEGQRVLFDRLGPLLGLGKGTIVQKLRTLLSVDWSSFPESTKEALTEIGEHLLPHLYDWN